MADVPGVHFGVHDEQEPAHEAVGHQHMDDGEDELIAQKITQVRRVLLRHGRGHVATFMPCRPPGHVYALLYPLLLAP